MSAGPRPGPPPRVLPVLLILALLAVTLVYWARPWWDRSPPTFRQAWTICQEFVTDRLQAPRSAVFAPFDPDQVSPLTAAPDQLRVHGVVDAQNAFGALIRHTYTCTVVPIGSGRWRLVTLTLEP